MQKRQKRFLSKAVILLILFIWIIPLSGVRVFAQDAISLSADRDEVKEGETLKVSIHLTGTAIWAYQIELSANEMFAGDTTLIEDHDGSNSVTVSHDFYAVMAGTGEIHAEGSYSDGESLIPFKADAIQITVRKAEEETAKEQKEETVKKQKEGTGGQAAPGQSINGEVVPNPPGYQSPGSDDSETENSVEEETNSNMQQAGTDGKTEKPSSPEKNETAQTQKGLSGWIIAGIIAVILLAGGAVIVAVRKKKKQNRP